MGGKRPPAWLLLEPHQVKNGVRAIGVEWRESGLTFLSKRSGAEWESSGQMLGLSRFRIHGDASHLMVRRLSDAPPRRSPMRRAGSFLSIAANMSSNSH